MNFAKLWQSVQQDRLPHALLFVGGVGSGRHVCAEQLVRSLLCAAPDALGKACEQCQGCLLLTAGTHPDFMKITPETPGSMIRVDAVRALAERVTQSPLLAPRRVVVIDPADAMNTASANALLKTLEEPPSATIFILVTDENMRLPATVKSRCQIVQFGQGERVADMTEQDAFLQAVHAMATGKMDPLMIAEKWSSKEYQAKVSLLTIVNWLQSWLREQVLTQGGAWLAAMEYVQKTRRWLALSPNLNRQLVLEDVLLHIRKI